MFEPQLQAALDFSAEDLAFNRQHRFSPRQEADEREGILGIRRLILIIIVLWLIADKDFQIPASAYNSLQEGQSVTVYYVGSPLRNKLLSLEMH